MKLLNLFKCFSTQVEETPELYYKYDNSKDGQCVYEKDCLFFLLCNFIDYDLPKPKRINNIEDIRELFYQKWRIMPIPFQQTYNVFTKDKLRKVIYEQLHSDNISQMLKTVVEHFNEKIEKEKQIKNENVLEHFEEEDKVENDIEEEEDIDEED